MTTRSIQPTFSSGSDIVSLSEALRPLLTTNGGRWGLTVKENGLERSFKFKTFKKTWEFMNAIAAECAVKRHHPEWSNVYNTTFIRWTTHSPPGLSAKDVEMAIFCDEQAALFGEVVPPPLQDVAQEGESGKIVKEKGGGDGEGEFCSVEKALADQVAGVAGDCCVPKKKV